MLDAMNRYLVQPFVTWKRGSRHLQYLRELERSQFDSPATVRDRQLAKLQSQLAHAYATVPFYRQTWDAAGVHPADVKSVGDLQHFPVLTKSDIRTRCAE